MEENKKKYRRLLYLSFHVILGVMIYQVFTISCSKSPTEFLSDEEIEWLNSQEKFDLIWGHSSPPEIFYDDDGKYIGLLMDMKNKIEDDLHYTFRFRNMKTWDSLINYSKHNKDYIIMGVARTREREKYLMFTDPLIKIPYVIVTRRNSNITSMNDLRGKKVCAVKGYSIMDFVDEYHDYLDPFPVIDEVSGLRAVSLGQYDAMLVGQLYCTYIIEAEGISNLKIAGDVNYINRLCLGVSRKNPMLFEIMDKAVNHIDKGEKQAIYSKWVTGKKELSSETIRLIIVISSILAAALLLLWIWLISLRRQVNKKTKQIKESESKYRILIENSHDAIYQIYKGHFILVNDQFEELFGYSKETLLSKEFDIYSVVAPESQTNVRGIVHDFYNIGYRPEKYEFIGITSKKEKRYLEVSVSYLDYKEGVATQGIIRDITNRKQREKELIEAKDKAEESDRLKSAFLANMSHEIRTPMNGILGFADLLNNPNISDEEQKKFIDVITRSGERMLNTINDIIDVSKIETGQVAIHHSEIDINAKLENLYNFFKPEANKKGIKLVYSTGSAQKDLFIKTDKTKFESILTNLIKNAIKFTDSGKIEFGYNIKDDILDFYVIDTGRGIPKDRQEAIFNRFEQADIEDKDAMQGSGLGLAIAKGYTELLGGKISVESAEDVGSKFSFTLPFHSLIKNYQMKSPKEQKINEQTGLPYFKILIVEDDKVSASYMKLIVKDISNDILYASNGKEAINLCKEHQDIDIILMDIKMPIMDGLQATKRIRDFNKDVMIIAQTAFALAGDENKSLEVGCDAYIAKPIRKKNLIDKITGHFSKRAS